MARKTMDAAESRNFDIAAYGGFRLVPGFLKTDSRVREISSLISVARTV
jgi:hypothetical protein